MNVIVPPIIACRQTKLGSTAALLVGASVLVFCLTLPLAQQHQMIGQRANSSGDLYHPTLTDISTPKTGSVSNSVSESLSSDTFHALSELDHKFLDDLFLYQERQRHDDATPTSVPKTELTLNTKTAKRAELVVHDGTIKRAELLRPGRN